MDITLSVSKLVSLFVFFFCVLFLILWHFQFQSWLLASHISCDLQNELFSGLLFFCFVVVCVWHSKFLFHLLFLSSVKCRSYIIVTDILRFSYDWMLACFVGWMNKMFSSVLWKQNVRTWLTVQWHWHLNWLYACVWFL